MVELRRGFKRGLMRGLLERISPEHENTDGPRQDKIRIKSCDGPLQDKIRIKCRDGSSSTAQNMKNGTGLESVSIIQVDL
jgi:hypothetical protein